MSIKAEEQKRNNQGANDPDSAVVGQVWTSVAGLFVEPIG